MNDIIERRITGEDDQWIYGEMWRNGQKTTDWVRLKDDALKAIGRANTERRLEKV